MTGCPFCSQFSDIWIPTLPLTPFLKHPYCPRCGKRKIFSRCLSCQGRGYIYQDNLMGPRYCTHCGRRIGKKVQCSVCGGTGEMSSHICSEFPLSGFE